MVVSEKLKILRKTQMVNCEFSKNKIGQIILKEFNQIQSVEVAEELLVIAYHFNLGVLDELIEQFESKYYKLIPNELV